MRPGPALASSLLLLCATSLTTGAHAAPRRLYATLEGAQEEVPITTDAIGSAEIVFDDETGRVSGTITFANLHDATGATTDTADAAHIHLGAPGASGGVSVDLGANLKSPATFENLVVPPADISLLLTGGTYVNVHTGKHPTGEIRGQLRDPDYQGGIDAGAQATDAGSSEGAEDGGATSATETNDGGCATTGARSSGGATTFAAVIATSALVFAAARRRARARRPSVDA